MNTKTIIILFILIAIILYMLMPRIIANNNKYNAYMCATQGLDSTCTHKLPASRELK